MSEIATDSQKTALMENLLRERHDKDPIAVCRKTDAFINRTESDFVAIKKSGMIYEYEIKSSRSDWMAEQRKRRWKIYNGEKHYRYDSLYIEGGKRYARPNYFYLVSPPGIVKSDELPWWCGHLVLSKDQLSGEHHLVMVKRTRKWGQEKATLEQALRFARAMRFRNRGDRA